MTTTCELCREEGYIWIPSTVKGKEVLLGKKCYENVQQHSILRTMQLRGSINKPCQKRVTASMEQGKIWIRSWN